MSALTTFFFRQDVVVPPTTTQTIAWWESRRLAYNAAVGATGLCSLVIINFIAALPPNSELIPWQANVILPLVYGGVANLCYTMGWVAELGLRRWLGDDVAAVGPAIFRYGFVFSIGLTLFPAGITFLAWLARLVLGG